MFIDACAFLLLLLGADSATATVKHKPCPSTSNKRITICVKLFRQYMTWSEARRNCLSQGGDLVWIRNADEHERINAFFLRAYGTHHWFHIGLFRTDGESPFTWTGGSPSGYRGQPFLAMPNVNQCIAKSRSKQINAIPPNVKYPSICRWV